MAEIIYRNRRSSPSPRNRHISSHACVANLQRVIEGARARGIPVLFGPMANTEADYKKHQLQRRSGINRVQFERKWFLAGS